jgi:integrase/recombinase XerD
LPAKLSTLLERVKNFTNKENAELIFKFYEFMKSNSSSENHIINNLKAIINFENFLHSEKSLIEIKRQDIIKFLDSKVKSPEIDPEKKWITTWNHYLTHLKSFFRWLYNENNKTNDDDNDIHSKPMQDWITPDFIQIKLKKTKRLSPYSHNEIWDKEELLTIIKYEPSKRNKAALALFWDLDARNHEVTLLKIKNIRLRERYGEGEVPHEAKTGSGPILLTLSFPYVRDWLNEHTFKNEPEARLICNLITGAKINPDAMWTMMKQLQKRIKRLVESGQIRDSKEREKLVSLIATKKWNPYCIRHSAITADSDYLPEYALKKKARWTMNSKQGSRYIKNRIGNELKNKILEHEGIITEKENIKKPTIQSCPRCQFVNTLETKYCSKCIYPLTPEAYDEIKQSEDARFEELEKRLEKKFKELFNVIDVQKLS